MTPEFDRKGCSNLVSALILLAVKDRRKALMMLKKVPDDKVSVDVEKDTREFFEGEWYQELREGLDNNLPSDLMRVLMEEK